jgi:hypothetical protein
MTENEKLRALLAEAREVARAVRNTGSLPYAQWSRDQHEADSFMERIDAALAEPVVDPVQAWKDANGYNDLLAAYSPTITERDEARAEVERLKEANRLLRHDADKEWGAAATAIAAAYQRGAEAMREAAAQVAHNRAILPVDTATDAAWCRSAACIEGVIRALPLPEDKS